MDLQVVSSLSNVPLLNCTYQKAKEYYTGVKKNYPVADSLLSTVEVSVTKASSLALPLLEKYQPQIEKYDQLANEQVVQRLINYCGPVASKSPEQLSEEAKQRVTAAVESVRDRAAKTRSQLYSAPSETVKMGRDMLSSKYHLAIEVVGEKAKYIRTEVPAMLPLSIREYIEAVYSQYGIHDRYEQLLNLAGSTLENVQKTYAGSSEKITLIIPSSLNISDNIVTPLRIRIEPVWNHTTKNFEATTELILDSYTWMKASRLAAISTARHMIDTAVGAVWEYTSDLSTELSETYSTGNSKEVFEIAVRRMHTGRDVMTQLARWTYGEVVALQDASTSVLDVILSSWLFHWLTFQPVMDRVPDNEHEMEPIASNEAVSNQTNMESDTTEKPVDAENKKDEGEGYEDDQEEDNDGGNE